MLSRSVFERRGQDLNFRVVPVQGVPWAGYPRIKTPYANPNITEPNREFKSFTDELIEKMVVAQRVKMKEEWEMSTHTKILEAGFPVVINPDLTQRLEIDKLSVNSEMASFAGNTAVVTGYNPRVYGYTLDVDKGRNLWNEEMFKPIKSILRPGQVVRYDDGEYRMVIPVSRYGGEELALTSPDGCANVSGFSSDLTSDSLLSIDRIYGLAHHPSGAYEIAPGDRDLLWERKSLPAKEMTVAEIEAALGYPIKVVK